MAISLLLGDVCLPLRIQPPASFQFIVIFCSHRNTHSPSHAVPDSADGSPPPPTTAAATAGSSTGTALPVVKVYEGRTPQLVWQSVLLEDRPETLRARAASTITSAADGTIARASIFTRSDQTNTSPKGDMDGVRIGERAESTVNGKLKLFFYIEYILLSTCKYIRVGLYVILVCMPCLV